MPEPCVRVDGEVDPLVCLWHFDDVVGDKDFAFVDVVEVESGGCCPPFRVGAVEEVFEA